MVEQNGYRLEAAQVFRVPLADVTDAQEAFIREGHFWTEWHKPKKKSEPIITKVASAVKAIVNRTVKESRGPRPRGKSKITQRGAIA